LLTTPFGQFIYFNLLLYLKNSGTVKWRPD